MATYQVPSPSPMSLKGDIVENWREFENAWEDYVTATELTRKLKKADGTDDPQGMAIVAATFCSVMGAECKKILNNLADMTPEKRRNPDEIIAAPRSHFVPQRNILYERFLFNTSTQKSGESVEQFVLRLRQLADSCEFETLKDSLIRDRIVIGTNDEAGRERLLRDRPVPDLAKVIDTLRAAEISRSHKIAMSSAQNTPVDHIKKTKGHHQHGGKKNGKQNQKKQSPVHPQEKGTTDKCKWRGNGKHNRSSCPARNSTCNKCNKRGHFAKVCLSYNSHEIEEDTEEIHSNETYMGEVNSITDDFWSVDVTVNDNPVTSNLIVVLR